ncbi:thioredoxin-dependent thiol peroxidase [Chelativorans sp. Marseille-P2723]|uniref:thioredoxin-dependent thiol peroxidase n=1 Tax=Chelativorans sp. Marseille-P2723 TaxID=2709133 RepID=UPI00156E8993|nr:thioredoxin-dependent thiol peroxidase [Chelativorans sp. Marseille-P2723]
MTIPAKGDHAPDFELPADGGRTVRLSDFRGRPLVLYFYPKDDTSGCTAQALDFSARKGEFDALGVAVIGVSPDTPKSHDKFKAKHGLEIVLVSDTDKDVLEAYGVWTEKSMYGRKYMGVERSTFLIDQEGKVAEVWRKVKVPGHVDLVLAEAKALLGTPS